MCLAALVPLAVPWQGGTAAILHLEHRERGEGSQAQAHGRQTTLLSPESTFPWGRKGEQEGLPSGQGARTSPRPSRRANTVRALGCCSKGAQLPQALGAAARVGRSQLRQRNGWHVPSC